MENLHLNDSIGQPYGYVLYETVIFGGGHLHTRDHVRDRAQVGAQGSSGTHSPWVEAGNGGKHKILD